MEGALLLFKIVKYYHAYKMLIGIYDGVRLGKRAVSYTGHIIGGVSGYLFGEKEKKDLEIILKEMKKLSNDDENDWEEL